MTRRRSMPTAPAAAGRAVSLAMVTHWVCNFAIGQLFLSAVAAVGVPGVYTFFAAVCFACVAFVGRFVVETKGCARWVLGEERWHCSPAARMWPSAAGGCCARQAAQAAVCPLHLCATAPRLVPRVSPHPTSCLQAQPGRNRAGDGGHVRQPLGPRGLQSRRIAACWARHGRFPPCELQQCFFKIQLARIPTHDVNITGTSAGRS